jgi:hypothetical protein
LLLVDQSRLSELFYTNCDPILVETEISFESSCEYLLTLIGSRGGGKVGGKFYGLFGWTSSYDGPSHLHVKFSTFEVKNIFLSPISQLLKLNAREVLLGP